MPKYPPTPEQLVKRHAVTTEQLAAIAPTPGQLEARLEGLMDIYGVTRRQVGAVVGLNRETIGRRVAPDTTVEEAWEIADLIARAAHDAKHPDAPTAEAARAALYAPVVSKTYLRYLHFVRIGRASVVSAKRRRTMRAEGWIDDDGLTDAGRALLSP